jgi:hypothetical protein
VRRAALVVEPVGQGLDEGAGALMQSESRRQRRATAAAMRRAHVDVVARTFLPPSITSIEATTTAIEDALERLEAEGADMSGRLVITIGSDHPDYPGRRTIEAKAASRR